MNFFNQNDMKNKLNNYGNFVQKELRLNDKLATSSDAGAIDTNTANSIDTSTINKLAKDYTLGNITLEEFLDELEQLGIKANISNSNGKTTVNFEYNGKSYHVSYNETGDTIFDKNGFTAENDRLHGFLDDLDGTGEILRPDDSDNSSDKPNGGLGGNSEGFGGNLGGFAGGTFDWRYNDFTIGGDIFKPFISNDDTEQNNKQERTEETTDANGNKVTTTYKGEVKVSETTKDYRGRLVSEKTYYASGNIQKETNYSFGSVESEKEYYDDKNNTVKFDRSYDYDGKLSKETENDSTGTKIKEISFNYSRNEKVESSYTDGVLSEIKVYDLDGNLLTTITYDKDGRTIKKSEGKIQTTIRHTNDGEVTEKETTELDDGKTKDTLFNATAYESKYEVGGYKYYKSDRISETVRRADGTVESLSEYRGAFSKLYRKTEYNDKGIKTKETKYKDNGNVESETEYNDKGIKTKETKYKYDGKVESETEYNDKGEKVSETKVDYQNNRTKTLYQNGVKTASLVYDASDKLISKTTYNADGSYTVEEYNSDGRVTSKKTYDSSGTEKTRVEVTYDSNGNRIETEYSVKSRYSETMISKSIYQKDTDVLLEYSIYNKAGRCENRYVYTYNADGSKATEKQYGYNNSLLVERTFDKQGREITCKNVQSGVTAKTTYDADGGKTVSTYDEKNKLIAQETYDKDGNLLTHTDWSSENGVKSGVIKNASGNIIGKYVENTDLGNNKTTTIEDGKVTEEKIVDKSNNTTTVKKYKTTSDGYTYVETTVTNTKTGDVQTIEEVLNEEGLKVSEKIKDKLGNIITETKISYSTDGTDSGQVLDKGGNVYATIKVTRDSKNRPIITTTYTNPQNGVYKTVENTEAVRLYDKYNDCDYVDGVETQNHYTTKDYRCVDNYNADGKISQRTIYDENGFVKTTQEYTYTYDNPNDKTTYVCLIKDSNGDWHKEYYVKGSKTTVYHYNKEKDVVVTEKYQNGKLVTGYNELKDGSSKNYYWGFIDGNVNAGRISDISVRTGFETKTGKNSPLAYFFMQLAGVNCPESSYLYKDYQKQNSYEDLKSLYGEERGEYISDYIKKMLENQVSDKGYTPDMVKGYYFNPNSAVSKEIKANKDFSSYVAQNRKAFEEGNMRGKSFNFNAHSDSNSKDLYYTFHAVHIVDSWKDENGKLHIVLADTYDFEIKDGGIAGAAGAAMNDGALRPFYSVMEIVM